MLALPLVSIGPVSGQALPLTPACGDKTGRTPSQTAGPFHTLDSPRRSSLVEPGSKAERLVLTGLVFSSQCKPAANALLDFWHCDEAGEYDNSGFRYRGHVFADALHLCQHNHALNSLQRSVAPYAGKPAQASTPAPRSRSIRLGSSASTTPKPTETVKTASINAAVVDADTPAVRSVLTLTRLLSC